MIDVTNDVHALVRTAESLAAFQEDRDGARRFMLAAAFAEAAHRDGLNIHEAVGEVFNCAARIMEADEGDQQEALQ